MVRHYHNYINATMNISIMTSMTGIIVSLAFRHAPGRCQRVCPPLRVHFENVVDSCFVQTATRKRLGKGVQQGSGIPKKTPFQIDPLPWTLNFLSEHPALELEDLIDRVRVVGDVGELLYIVHMTCQQNNKY